MSRHPFSQVDVFSARPGYGNPVAVVHDAEDLDEEEMAAFARWTNLSETTFLLPATDTAADYRLRIFTPGGELPFAGHPTLGSAHAWLASGATPAGTGRVVQECGVGLVELRREEEDLLAFRAPDLLRSGPVEEAVLRPVLAALGLEPDRLLSAAWVDNGPGWIGLELDSAATVLSLRPDAARLDRFVGVLGAHTVQEQTVLGAAVEVRAFCPATSGITEDPVTGSLNAGFARWLVPAGRLPGRYVARQGTVLGREGRVHVRTDPDGASWVAGRTRTVVSGSLDLSTTPPEPDLARPDLTGPDPSRDPR